MRLSPLTLLARDISPNTERHEQGWGSLIDCSLLENADGIRDICRTSIEREDRRDDDDVISPLNYLAGR